MQVTESTILQVHTEQRFIAKYAGMLSARITIMFCLFLLFFCMRQIPVYLFAFSFLFPWVWSNILVGQKKERTPVLFHTAQKYHYTTSRYRAEKLTYQATFFFLVVWQVSLWKYNPFSALLLPVPSALLVLLVLIRIISTLIVRYSIHKYYTSLQSLS